MFNSKKITLGLICGGQSAEHEVSLRSAAQVLAALDRTRYEVVIIGISRDGQWWRLPSETDLTQWPSLTADNLPDGCQLVVLLPGSSGQLLVLSQPTQTIQLSVALPILHGTGGEDGAIQGLLKLAGLPFVGADVLGSATCMDKIIMKRLLREAGLPIGKFLAVANGQWPSAEEIEQILGWPVFVKPANLGSSVGISRVGNSAELAAALRLARQYDDRIILEANIVGREIECAVLGNDPPRAALPGEIVMTGDDFYSYDAKYLSPQAARLVAPADLSDEVSEQIQTLAIQTFQTLCVRDLARVDFFLRPNGEILINEINTLPGFTDISMYPRCWAVSGLSYSQLLDKLLELALARAN